MGCWSSRITLANSISFEDLALKAKTYDEKVQQEKEKIEKIPDQDRIPIEKDLLLFYSAFKPWDSTLAVGKLYENTLSQAADKYYLNLEGDKGLSAKTKMEEDYQELLKAIKSLPNDPEYKEPVKNVENIEIENNTVKIVDHNLDRRASDIPSSPPKNNNKEGGTLVKRNSKAGFQSPTLPKRNSKSALSPTKDKNDDLNNSTSLVKRGSKTGIQSPRKEKEEANTSTSSPKRNSVNNYVPLNSPKRSSVVKESGSPTRKPDPFKPKIVI